MQSRDCGGTDRGEWPTPVFPKIPARWVGSVQCEQGIQQLHFPFHTGANLGGHVDPVAVEALHLPVIEDAERAGGPTSAVAEGETPQPKEPGPPVPPKHDVEEGNHAKEGAVAFAFSDSFPPIPAKLVGKILKGDFVDMAELLRDNIEAERRGGQGEGGGNGNRKPPRREVPAGASALASM